MTTPTAARPPTWGDLMDVPRELQRSRPLPPRVVLDCPDCGAAVGYVAFRGEAPPILAVRYREPDIPVWLGKYWWREPADGAPARLSCGRRPKWEETHGRADLLDLARLAVATGRSR